MAFGRQLPGDSPHGIAIIHASKANSVTWIAWAIFLLAVCTVLFWKETGKPVNRAYACGAQRWLAHESLYDGGSGFIYLPQSAILYAPFHLLPYAAEQILWRIVTVGLFAVGVFRLSRLVGNQGAVSFFPLVSLLVLPKTWTSAYSGQATLAMAGLLMMALAEIRERKWSRSAALLVAALAFKPLAIVLILLVGAIYRPMIARLALGLALLFVAPYLARDAQYVNGQYVAALPMFDDAMKMGLEPNWAQIFSLGSLVGFQISEQWQTLTRIALALVTLALCRRASRHTTRNSKPGSLGQRAAGPAPDLLLIYALATAYLLLFNPRSENNSYVMLSPVLAVFCARAYYVERRTTRAGLLGAGVVALVAGHEVCGLLTPDAGFIWTSPLVCLLFAVDCVLAVIRGAALPAARLAYPHRFDQPVGLPFPSHPPSEIVGIADAA